jgi:hypothetical protein
MIKDAQGKDGRWLMTDEVFTSSNHHSSFSIRMRRWIFKSLGLLFVLAVFLGGLILLGQWALENIRQRERYTIALADIDCDPPPGMTRAAFLDEVQYLADLPGKLNLLDDDLGRRLAIGFSRHPWVQKVEEVEMLPTRQVKIHLVIRRPVLAVKLGKELRAVDGWGVLLPTNADTAGLPVYQGKPRPHGPDGSRWGDAALEAQAKALQKK